MNNKGADQTARMRRLVCACVVRKPPKTGFLASRPIEHMSIWKFHKALTPMRIHNIVSTQCTNMAEDSVVIACSRICKYFISVVEKVMNEYVGKPHILHEYPNALMSTYCKYGNFRDGFIFVKLRISWKWTPREMVKSLLFTDIG